ncbi:hypothetical protein AB0G74_33905 [Streptomyces sp. NPDC020875]|uniref:hypothetical protein n=1 Tax=Streptomyces sp. NPDC020875 TaxID=3154898 RepID=UPI0033FE867B
MAQMTPAHLRAQAEKALGTPGGKRLRLLKELEKIDAELRPVILAAREAEVPIRRITELTGVAPNTVRAWAKGPA